MKTFKFCKLCLYSTLHPFGLTIDEDGICSGCKIHREKETLDWSHRFKLLKRITNSYKLSSKRNYDCIVPVTGGTDSFFTLHIVKNVLKLNPLLVSYNKYFNTSTGIENLSNLRVTFDADILIQNVNPISVKKITKHTMFNFGSIYWPILAGQTSFPVQIACKYQIPLIIWGAHQGIEQVGMYSYTSEVEMSRRYRKNHDLMGIEADDLLDNFDTLKESDIFQYRYPDDSLIEKIGVRGIYLNNYIRWDQKSQNELMVTLYKYKTKKFNRTFDKYDHVDCFNYMEIHDLLKLFKHGYSKVTDQVNREIRFGRISRSQGIHIIKKYELKEIINLNLFLEWMNIKEDSILFLFNQIKNEFFWKKINNDQWKFEGLSSYFTKGISRNSLENSYINNTSKHEKNKYIIFGKGWYN